MFKFISKLRRARGPATTAPPETISYRRKPCHWETASMGAASQQDPTIPGTLGHARRVRFGNSPSTGNKQRFAILSSIPSTRD